MDSKLKEWLDAQEAKRLSQRDKHLRDLGLYEPNPVGYLYYNSAGEEISFEEYSKLKEGEGSYERNPGKAIKVTDEEYDLICKYAPPVEERKDLEYLSKIESHTKVLSTVVIVMIVISVIFLLIGGCEVLSILDYFDY